MADFSNMIPSMKAMLSEAAPTRTYTHNCVEHPRIRFRTAEDVVVINVNSTCQPA